MRKIQFRDRTRLFLTLFLAGFGTGVFYIAVFGKAAVHNTTLMSPYFFSKYRYMEFASAEIFLYTLKSRLSSFTLLWLMGLTVAGVFLVHAYLFWIGAALGITVTTAAMKMGAQGIFLCLAGSLPHFILYVPACCWLFKKICERAGGGERKLRYAGNGRRALYAYLLVWAAGLAVFLAGAFLESYVNPFFLKTILKKF